MASDEYDDYCVSFGVYGRCHLFCHIREAGEFYTDENDDEMCGCEGEWDLCEAYKSSKLPCAEIDCSTECANVIDECPFRDTILSDRNYAERIKEESGNEQ